MSFSGLKTLQKKRRHFRDNLILKSQSDFSKLFREDLTCCFLGVRFVNNFNTYYSIDFFNES